MNQEFKDFSEQILKGLQKAYRKVVEDAKLKNEFLIVSENGKVVKIPAKDIKFPE
ncbi:MAG: hypothetical protein RIQ33_1602 [Bacteroidota bacterium]|jgi:DUF917 family protein